jgi:hypothetical protein
MDVAREARDDHELARAGDDLVQDGADASLARRVPRLLGVRRVAEEQVHAPARLLRERVEVGRAAVERRLVDLEISRVQDGPVRRVDRDRHAVGDRVRHAHEAHRERPNGRALADDGGAELGAFSNAVLLQLPLEQREGERRAVHREMIDLP